MIMITALPVTSYTVRLDKVVFVFRKSDCNFTGEYQKLRKWYNLIQYPSYCDQFPAKPVLRSFEERREFSTAVEK